MNAKTKPKAAMAGSTADFLASLTSKDPLLAPELIDLDDIDPDEDNTRSTFRALDGVVPEKALQSIEELADDIEENKLTHPITVVEVNGRKKLVAGERRWRAFKFNRDVRGLRPQYERIPAFVRRDLDPARAGLLQLSENIQREDVSDLDIANKLVKIMEQHPELQKKDLAKLLKKPASYISRILGMVNKSWSHVIDSGLITYASVLEQFKALPDDVQKVVVKKAKAEHRPINTKDIADAKRAHKIAPDVAKDVSDVLGAFAPKAETYDPAHAAAVRGLQQQERIVDHGGDAMIPASRNPSYDTPPMGVFGMDLTVRQLAVLVHVGALGDDDALLNQKIRISWSPDALRAAIEVCGGEAPAQDGNLTTVLLDAVNAQL